MRLILATLLAAVLMTASATAPAAWGDRDCSWGSSGVQSITNFGSTFTMGVEATGNILLRTGYIGTGSSFVRLGPDGGTVPIAGVGYASGGFGDIVDPILADGKILLLTYQITSPPSPPGVGRVLPSGNIDTTFGTNGYAAMSGLPSVRGGPFMLPDGRFLITGSATGFTSAALGQFNANGSPDMTFGSAGLATNAAAGDSYASAAIQADGRILALSKTTLVRHLADGQVDSAFGTAGAVTLPVATTGLQVRVQPSGHIIVAFAFDANPRPLHVARYDASGALVTTRAVVLPSLPAGQNNLLTGYSAAMHMHMMADGRPVLVGAIGNTDGNSGAVVRLNVDLTDDVGIRTPYAPSIAFVLPSGKILTGGWNTYEIRRFLGDADAATCTVTTTSMTSSPNPSVFGQVVTLTATVSSSPAPVGSVQFRRGSNLIGFSVSVNAGVATLSTTSLPAGTYDITATFVPAGAFSSSTSAPVSQTVVPGLSINDPTANSALATPVMSFVVTIGGGASSSTVIVDYATSDQSAIAGTDYTATSGTLTFNPGETTKTVDVLVTPRSVPGPGKSFFLTLSNATNASIQKGAGIGTIVYASSGTLSMYISDATVMEGHSGVTLLGFTVSLSKSNPSNLTVSYATANDTAIAGTDYTAQSGTLTFRPGQTQQWVIVPVAGNAVAQANRSFFVNLTNASAGVIADAQGVGTIVDDDPTPAASTRPMYRLYSNATKEHLYTTDANEYAVLPSAGWVAEGTAYTMFASAGSYNAQFAIPLYRLNHPGILQHHWTTDSNEVMVLVASGYWQYEGIPGYLLPAADAGSTPLFRLSYAYPPLHLWTTDAHEKDVLSTQYGWTYEGVMGEVLP